MAIDTEAVESHGAPIAFSDLIAFDAERRRFCARFAWNAFAAASDSPYDLHASLTTEEWKANAMLLADENPHWKPELKADVMRRVERIRRNR